MKSLIKKIFIVSAILATSSAMSDETDAVPILGPVYTDEQEELVRAGAKTACEIHEEFEDREQCAMDYFVKHNYDGDPECED